MNQAFGSTGMTPQQYIDMMQQYVNVIPANQRADFNTFLTMLQGCQ